MKRFALAIVFTLTGCSSSNIVERITSETSVIKHSNIAGYEDRYTNIYNKFKDYPVTCEENCYPPTQQVQCQSEMQDCTFIGNNPVLALDTGFTIQWLGHASFKINTPDNQQLLFDPVSAQFDWPVNWAFRLFEGYNRNPPAALSQAELAQTDAVLYSHIHYDHFNKDDIATIGTAPNYLTPLGFAEHFPDDGYKVSEMAWYSNKQLGDVTIHFVPANHFSSRIWVPFLYEDHGAALWGGWVVEHQGNTLFFAGDTGYSPHFKDIQQKYGDIDICLLPIASYHSEEDPQWYRKVHTTPEDALVAANELGCKVMVPWGYGNASWKMGDRTSHSALFRLLHMQQQLKTQTPVYVLNEGQSIKL
ncbi:MBL fold metallo-hydrolase [Pseudoalteromonas piscicida]|uniref:Zn-dependent hydrolase n=1 Tax=Pseudoalteromonas piscicida TaxID=43662 RepID=A0A2A5JQH2_PSEO7|nr:MBL fold metallo-hydrolase [Pseudoalteromonas piscicida]PCK31712.1 Zn-dependent hydrolase [Pseudoalteromonas piscicida]